MNLDLPRKTLSWNRMGEFSKKKEYNSILLVNLLLLMHSQSSLTNYELDSNYYLCEMDCSKNVKPMENTYLKLIV